MEFFSSKMNVKYKVTNSESLSLDESTSEVGPGWREREQTEIFVSEEIDKMKCEKCDGNNFKSETFKCNLNEHKIYTKAKGLFSRKKPFETLYTIDTLKGKFVCKDCKFTFTWS